MKHSVAIGWRAFGAHIVDLGIWFYIVGVIIGFIFSFDFYTNLVLTFLIAIVLSFVSSAVFFALFSITPSEWLWGCKLQIEESSRNRFLSYLMHRLCMKESEYIDYKQTAVKTSIGFILLLLVVGAYCF